ncbi:MAG TPA: flagellar basal body P-ring formation chaperone FlgA [Candidatus Desulfobacillus sp.]|nr:flagellar basal body P-ring formation chaperone FlgA [Candidatus Desulfobacillus sp.]
MTACRALFLFLLCALAAAAHARQDTAEVRRAIEAFLQVQTKGLPGEASFQVGAIDPNNNLVPCPALEVFLPAGSRPWGRINVGVRCQEAGGWSIYVPVQIRVMGEYLVTSRPMARGQVVTAGDLARRRGDLAGLPPGILTEDEQAVGKTLGISVQSGQILRSDILRAPLAVQQGQSVRIVSTGKGFQVSTEGKALGNAADGQVVQVRAASGQTLSGIARAGGTVEISY